MRADIHFAFRAAGQSSQADIHETLPCVAADRLRINLDGNICGMAQKGTCSSSTH